MTIDQLETLISSMASGTHLSMVDCENFDLLPQSIKESDNTDPYCTCPLCRRDLVNDWFSLYNTDAGRCVLIKKKYVWPDWKEYFGAEPPEI